jgi:S1-C subfamily serine protease
MTCFAIAAMAFPSSARAFEAPPGLARFETDIKTAIAQVRPAVVKISAFGTGPKAGSPNGPMLDRPVAFRSVGSGVLVDPRGYVLTNAHVVRDFTDINVTLWRSPPGEYVGVAVSVDKDKDLALLKLGGRGPFPYTSIPRSVNAQVGDWVIAIGSPYGLEHTASLGIVSDRLSSLWIDGRNYKNLVQTDAAINQGNSGGPLINLRGDIVGISTAIFAPQGVFAGVGFAIPTDLAADFLDAELPDSGFVQVAAAVEKEPIRPDAKSPHPFTANCSNCHTFLKPSPAPKVAEPVAIPVSAYSNAAPIYRHDATDPLLPPALDSEGFFDDDIAAWSGPFFPRKTLSRDAFIGVVLVVFVAVIGAIKKRNQT